MYTYQAKILKKINIIGILSSKNSQEDKHYWNPLTCNIIYYNVNTQSSQIKKTKHNTNNMESELYF